MQPAEREKLKREFAALDMGQLAVARAALAVASRSFPADENVAERVLIVRAEFKRREEAVARARQAAGRRR